MVVEPSKLECQTTACPTPRAPARGSPRRGPRPRIPSGRRGPLPDGPVTLRHRHLTGIDRPADAAGLGEGEAPPRAPASLSRRPAGTGSTERPGDDRRPFRHLFARMRPLRVAGRGASVQRPHGPGHPRPGLDRVSAPPGDGSHSVSPASAPSTRRAGLALAIVAGLAIVGAGAWFMAGRSRHQGPPRIAVVPFENLGAAEDEFFADGVADEVRTKLASLPGVIVTARARSNSRSPGS